MSALTEPQSWVLIGVFTTIMLGGMTMMTMVISARVDGLRGEMNARFEAVNTKFDHLDREVASLSRRMWDGSSGD